MPSRPKKVVQKRGAEGIPEEAFYYFIHGPYFEGEDWAAGKSKDEIEAFRLKHRRAIDERYRAEGLLKNDE